MSDEDVTAAAHGASPALRAQEKKKAQAFGCVDDPRRLRIELSRGPFSVLFYEPMSLDDIEDAEATLAILFRSLRRRIALNEPRGLSASEAPTSAAAVTTPTPSEDIT